jgi:L-ascorbate metabolism protein UlaG (beta-lactamase superfamily)
MFADITDEQLETLGVIDILIIPVGGFGYTMDAIGAAKIVRKIDPKVVIPTHYADAGTTYPVNQADLDDFIKELGAPVVEEDKLKIKAGSLPESLTVVKLKRL